MSIYDYVAAPAPRGPMRVLSEGEWRLVYPAAAIPARPRCRMALRVSPSDVRAAMRSRRTMAES